MADNISGYMQEISRWRDEGLSLRAIAGRLAEIGGPVVDPKTIAARLRKPVQSLEHISEQIRSLAVPIGTLQPDRRNARRHPENNLTAIKGSLQEFGQMKPIVANVRSGKPVVIAGNGTLEAALGLGWTHIAVITVNVSEATAAAFALADNRTAELAEWDAQTLAAILMELEHDDVDMSALGFDDEFVKAVLADANPSGDDDLPGDIEWSNALGRLPDGERAPFQQMTFTLHDDQVKTVKEAMEAAKRLGAFIDTGNENSNGNALARVCEMFLGSEAGQ